MPDPLHDDTAPPADPLEAELVAYLDGELEPAAARRVETRLASDPKARARAAVLKKTYDLLDYLPRPEPSATFTTRTLDKLPAILASQPAAQPPPASAALATPKPRSSQSVPVISPLALPSGVQPMLSLDAPTGPYRFAWVAGLVLLASAFAAVGYFVTAALRPSPDRVRQSTKESVEEPLPANRRAIENLALYAGVDDLAFAKELAKPEYFGNDPAVLYNPTLAVPSLPRPTLDIAAFAEQEQAFRALSRERQQAIRDLDRQLYDEPAASHLLRVLEAYAVWLNRLEDADRQAVLGAAAGKQRLEKVQAIRSQQWFDRLPPNVRAQLSAAVDKEERIRKLRAEEAQRKLLSATLDLGHTPWPFDTDKGRAEVLAFAKLAFRLEEKPDAGGKPRLTSERLTANEVDRYATALAFAQAQGGEAWTLYGRTLYDLLQLKTVDDYLLPSPAEPKLRFATFGSLPEVYHKFTAGAGRAQLQLRQGKWPEYPLELHREVHNRKASGAKLDALKPLGPSRPSEYKPEVQAVIQKLPPPVQNALARHEGKWPDYPRELIRLARMHDLSVPEAMLPGPPTKWEATYGKAK